jgi:spore coat protein U-like protein
MYKGLFRCVLAAGVLGILSAVQGEAGATTQVPIFSTPMTVTAVYGGSSTINVSPMNFGNVQNGGFGKNLAVALIQYQGPGGNTITIGPGLYWGFCTTASRCMVDNADPNYIGTPTFNHFLPYQLYKDPGRTLVWGDGTITTNSNTGVFALGSTLGQPTGTGQTLYVYGAILQQSGGGVGIGGTFTDTVMVTING